MVAERGGVGSRRNISSVKLEDNRQRTAHATENVVKAEDELPEVRDGILEVMDEDLISLTSAGGLMALFSKMKGDYDRYVERVVAMPVLPRIMEEIIEVICLVSQERIHERIVEETIDVPVSHVMERTIEDVKLIPQEHVRCDAVEHIVNLPVPQIRKETGEVTRLIPHDCDELIPKWLKVVKGVVDSEDFLLNIYRDTLLQNKILRVTKKNLVKEFLGMFPDIAEKKDDYKKFYERFGECLKLGVHEGSTDRAKIVELLRFKAFMPGDEQISFKEYFDRMKEGQNDMCYTTDERNAVVSSSSSGENLRKKGHEVLYVANPLDEYAVRRPKEFNGMKVKPTTKEGLDLGDQNEKKSLQDLKIEPGLLRKLMKEILGDKIEEVIVDDRIVDYLHVFTMLAHDLYADMERVMKAQALRDNSRHTATEYGGSANMGSIQSTRQQHNNYHSKQSIQRREGKEEKGQEESEKGRKGEGERGQTRRKEEEEKAAVEERSKQVEKDVMDWTVVTRNRRQRKMIQIFVKVDGSKVTPMEVSLKDDKVEDVMRRIQNDEDAYVTMQGRVLKRSEKLKSCGVTDGCTIQVTSRLRGGGKHKDKKGQKERKQAAKQKGPEQKTEEEPKRDKGPVIRECDKDSTIRMIEGSEGYQKIVKMISEGSDEEYGMQCFRAELREKSGLDENQMKVLECGVRWAVEARRKERSEEKRQQEHEEQRRQAKQGQNARQELSKQGKQVRFGDEEQFKETEAESTDEQKVTDGLAEVRTGRGNAGLVRGGDERCRADETSRKGKGKGNGSKGEHEGKGGAGSKGRQQVENSVMDEDQRNTGVMRSEEEEENHKEDVRKLLEMVEKEEMELEMMLKEEMEQEEQRGRVAPNMGAGGSHLQATSDPREKETEERRKRTRRPRWADCKDDEGKEEEEQETGREGQEEVESKKGQVTEGEEKEQQEKEKELRQKTGQEERTSEKPPGLEVNEESEHEVKEAREEERSAQEAREEERSAQEAREEQKRAQEVREEQRRAQEARREEKGAQDAQEERRDQEEREKEVRAQMERRRAEAQEGHEGKEVLTTQEECVEEKKETNSMQEKDVPNRHMTWWKNAWWVRMDNGPHLRTARGRRRVWRAARRAAEQARDSDRVEETHSFAEEAEGEKWGRKKWEQGSMVRKESNTLHIVFHLPTATASTTTATAVATAAAMQQHQ